MLRKRPSGSNNSAGVSVGVTDIRAEPDFHSERLSQALWGTKVKITGDETGCFVPINLKDGHSGFIRLSQLRIPFRASRRDIRITAGMIQVRKSPSPKSETILLVHFNTEFSLLNQKKQWVEVSLGKEQSGWIPVGSFDSIESLRLKSPIINNIVKTAKSFIGTPYLWGGIAPSGWDCSGFVQAIFKQFGITLPRDTKDQIEKGRSVKYGGHRAGDLLFFKRHVGIAISRELLIHSSAHHGGVFVDNLGDNADGFGRELLKNLQAIKRII